MTKESFLEVLSHIDVDIEKVNLVHQIYNQVLPEVIVKIVSLCSEPVFLDDGTRILAFDEIIDAERDLQIPFSAKELIPIADCGDNDFIVYDFSCASWAKYNIVDEIEFKKRNALSDLLK